MRISLSEALEETLEWQIINHVTRCIKCGYTPSNEEISDILHDKIPIAKGIKWLVKNNDK